MESYKAVDAMFGSLKRNTTLKRLEVRMVGTWVFKALSSISPTYYKKDYHAIVYQNEYNFSNVADCLRENNTLTSLELFVLSFPFFLSDLFNR